MTDIKTEFRHLSKEIRYFSIELTDDFTRLRFSADVNRRGLVKTVRYLSDMIEIMDEPCATIGTTEGTLWS